VEGTVIVLGKVLEDMSLQEIDTEAMRGSYGMLCSLDPIVMKQLIRIQQEYKEVF
jgi:hypothetical protein